MDWLLSCHLILLMHELLQLGVPGAILADYNRFLAAWDLPPRSQLQCGCCGKDHSQATDFHSYIPTHDGAVYCSTTCYMVGVSEEVQQVSVAQFEQARQLQRRFAGRADFEVVWRVVHQSYGNHLLQQRWAKHAKEFAWALL